MLPAASAANYRRQQALTATVVASVRRAWRRMRPKGDWSEQWRRDVGPKATAVVLAGQLAVSRESDRYVTNVLDELGMDASSPTAVEPRAFIGAAGDGRPVDTLLEQAVAKARRTELDAEQALRDAEAWMDQVVQTIMADTARAAESTAMVQREWVDGWVRMLNPPSCSRCVILAGRFYLWNDGFERHPGCDCRHIPATESQADDIRVDPQAYFDSLPPADQDRIFTHAGAEAIRDGADMGRVVNARRGVRKAQLLGRDVLATSTGTTRRRKGPVPVRLMPESIYELAKDRADAIRLLKLHGFIV